MTRTGGIQGHGIHCDYPGVAISDERQFYGGSFHVHFIYVIFIKVGCDAVMCDIAFLPWRVCPGECAVCVEN